MSELRLVETHCHLDYLKAYPLNEILELSKKVGVEKLITISVSPDNFEKVIEISNNNSNVYCSQGFHPHEANKVNDQLIQAIKKNALANPKKVVAIGEIGLDFHYNKSPKDEQIIYFRKQLDLAIELDLPVIIHTREADEDTISILKEYEKELPRKGVLHSFTSSQKLAETALEMGFYLGFNGIISFKNAENVRSILKICRPDQVLLETDAPFLTPMPHRGKENGPYFLNHVCEKMAEILNVPAKNLSETIWKNSHQLFSFS